ncbi:TonB-dependent hemoglobin/transferrin/lactoferrin family receptor [Leptolyngbya sp. 'hensonii']|uniref:TonB-dependent hemoglobin/transferrin/lactoferrin family receptor n=1 Tax=Leptolyngbya sp. 'hensonii' TaxID=1922337 RepID=UPI00209B4195|nr:TonB-dependent hemoglobin/transferrin/lactoferrin family receptor [Leptolyngbya sp. 'hensonii']
MPVASGDAKTIGPHEITASETDQSLAFNPPVTALQEGVDPRPMAERQGVVQVTQVQLDSTETGLNITLATADGTPLQIEIARFSKDGNALVAEIPNAVLALPEGNTFQRTDPIPGIALVKLLSLNATTIQIRVVRSETAPVPTVTLSNSGILYSLDPETDDQTAEGEEEEITVTGTRTPRPTRLTPASISVIDEREIDEFLVRDLRDVFRYEPNISVGNDRRYGLQDINIRGLGGNRVLILNDGIRVPNQFQFGTPSLGRDYVDLETLQRIEVVRGPASALYGSDALGGVVSFRTIDPGDLLNRIPGQSVVTSLSANVETVDRSSVFTGIVAFREGDLEGLLGYTRRDGSEARVPTGNEFVDARSNARNNGLGKLIYRLNDTSKIGFTAEFFRNEDDFTVAPITAASLIGPTGFRGQNETLENNTSRDRFSLFYLFDDPNGSSFLNAARIQVYYQNAEVNEVRTQDFVRTGAGVDRRRLRNLQNTFLDRTVGAEVQLQSRFNLDTVVNQLTYGVDISSTRNERVRNGLESRFNAAGLPILTTNVIGADNFPVKDFPDSDTFRLGLYIQDEIALDNTLTLIPGVRFDVYQLSTQIDALYLRNPGATAANFSDSALSPNLGVVWRATPELAIVGRYARGFRAPLYNEINSGFTNLTSPTFRYKTLSNPNLRPETSDTFEVGVRGAYPQFNFSLTGFYNSYDNFIEAFAPAGIDLTLVPGFPVNLFQTQNVARARTYGFELSGEYRFSPQADGFSLIAGLGLTVGDNLTTNQPLESVDPFKAVVGFRYRAPENLWGADLIATFAAQPRLRDNRPLGSYTPQGYTVVDLIGYYNITPLITLNLGVFNLLNDQYFLYSDVRPLINSPTPADIARFAQPGISLRAGITWRF